MACRCHRCRMDGCATYSRGVSMVGNVFRLEWRHSWRDSSVRAIVVVFALLVAYAAFGGARLVSTARDAHATAQLAEAERLDVLRRDLKAISAGAQVKHAADPRDPLRVGRELAPRVASLPPGPLAVVAVGQRDVLPAIVELTTNAKRAGPRSDEGASPLKQSNGPFDLAFVFVFLLPLVVIALSYDLLSRERERGTLSLVLSQPISLTTFVLGKSLQRAALVVALAVGFGLVGPIVADPGVVTSGGGLRLTLYVLLLALYVLFWLVLAIFVNALGRSSAANALTLVGFWLALLVVVPGLASVAVDTAYPSPSRVELVNLARAAASDAESRTTQAEGDHGKPASATSAEQTVAMQAELERQLEPVQEKFREQHRKQQGLVDKLRFLSPAILLNEGLSDVAGSGVTRHQHFSDQVDEFHARLKTFFEERIRQDAALTIGDYDAMPQFVYQEAPDKKLGLRVGASLLALAIAIAGLLALTAVKLRAGQAGRIR